MNEYTADKFFVSNGATRLTRTEEYIYDQNDATGTKSTFTATNYLYNTTVPTATKPHLQLAETKQSTSNANGEIVVTKMKYPLDYTVPATSTGEAKAIKSLQDKHVVNAVIETYTQRQNSDGTNPRVISGQITTYIENPNNINQVVPYQIRLLETNSSVAAASFTPSTVSSSAIVADSRYVSRITFHDYDASGNITRFAPSDGVSVSYLWGYSSTLPIAEVKNTVLTRLAYNSFEEGEPANWTITGGTASSNTASKTGKYLLQSTSSPMSLSRSFTTGSYLVSFWAMTTGGASFTINGSTATTLGATWTYYQREVTLTATGSVSLNFTSTSGNVRLDEVRLHPKESQMTTFTYLPLEGITTQTNAAGISSYFEYDNYQRLKYVKDFDGNIIKSYVYHYKGQP
jgi:hypothetical protein